MDQQTTRIDAMMDMIAQLVEVAQSHERRINNLEE